MIKYFVIASLLMLLSIFTPMFSWLLGGMLGLIGDWYGQDASEPSAYVVLGGGLTERMSYHDGKPLVVLNNYTVVRTQTLWQNFNQKPLPIITSGVESPWMVDAIIALAKKDNVSLVVDNLDDGTWAKHVYGMNNHVKTNSRALIISENASMNTCENARFTAYLLDEERKNHATLAIGHHVYLISDWYHMARARRQFALLGLATTPIVAPMPSQTSWRYPIKNFDHSRRAFYESMALLRDIIKPQKDCRHADELGVKVLKTARRNQRTF